MKRLFAFCLLSVAPSLFVNAQLNSTPPWNKPGTSEQTFEKKPKDRDTPTDVPFDGGVGALLIAGALYGKRVYSRNKAARARTNNV